MNIHGILLVDDEPNIVKALQRLFGEEGYELHAAQSGEEGLKILEAEKIDLVISDQKMQGMSGIEFLEKTIEPYPDIIRIILTGHGELEDAMRAVNSGCIYKFVLKPWDSEDLKITVRRSLEQRDLLVKNRDLTLELKKRDKIMADLERKYPGITKRPKDGIFEIKSDE